MTAPNIPLTIIRNMKRLTETYTINEDGSRGDGFLYEALREANRHNIFDEIFKKHKSEQNIAVFKVAFIVLAYDHRSPWLNVGKDRATNKMEIISSLLKDSGLVVPEEYIEMMTYNEDALCRDAANMYIDSQKSADFKALIALIEHRAFVNKMAMKFDDDTTDLMLKQRSDSLKALPELRRSINELTDEIQTKYMPLDDAMRREGLVPISEDLDLSQYETRLKFIARNNIVAKRTEGQGPICTIQNPPPLPDGGEIPQENE